MSIKDGMPAFPGTEANGLNNGCPGLSMRDYFAAKALQGLLANPGGPIQANDRCGWSFCNCNIEQVASEAYGFADAMIKARES